MDDVDLDALARQLGDEAAVDARTLRNWNGRSANQGFLDRGSDGSWRLSPKAMRQLGQAALRDVAQQLWADTASGTPARRCRGRIDGATRPWEFGDAEPWNVARTVTNAVLRQGRRRRARSIRLMVEDVEVSKPKRGLQAAVALLVDTSFSMVMRTAGADEAHGAGPQSPGQHPVQIRRYKSWLSVDMPEQ